MIRSPSISNVIISSSSTISFHFSFQVLWNFIFEWWRSDHFFKTKIKTQERQQFGQCTTIIINELKAKEEDKKRSRCNFIFINTRSRTRKVICTLIVLRSFLFTPKKKADHQKFYRRWTKKVKNYIFIVNWNCIVMSKCLIKFSN